MRSEQYQRAKALFAEAINLPESERESWLKREAADDADVLNEVAEMLAEESNPHPAARQLDDGAASMLDGSPEMPERIGKYRILGVKGQGGMGIVYEAEQESPKRLVALKVIRTPMMSPQLLSRFRREAEALGMLQHAGIAHIYEAAITQADSGEQPFLAMELIHGERITNYADKHNLSTRQRLELLARVCDAVQHAHQRGIIHRDLKPANILVVEPDTSITGSLKTVSKISDLVGQPKILDFGVARLTEGDMKLATLQTEVGQLIGTLAYMSPEQVSGDSSNLDTRCDIYALGVLLYELLSGQLPHDLRNRSIAQAARVIQEEEPTRLSRISADLRGDLDTIVAKALEKDREHRYQSASEMAADLRRFLADEPIVARPASAIYQLQKFARRNKGLVAGLIVAFLVLLLGATGTAIGLASALQANRQLAETNSQLERSNTDLKNVSEFQSAQLTDIDVAQMGVRLRDDLLGALPEDVKSVFESHLGSVDFIDYARSTLDHSIFSRAIDTVEVQFNGQPHLQAMLQQDLATAMRELGLYQSAKAPQRRALEIRRRELGNDHIDTIASITESGLLAQALSDFEQADVLLREALERTARLHGENAKGTWAAMSNVASNLKSQGKLDDAVDFARKAVDGLLEAAGPEDLETVNANATLAAVLNAKGEYNEAIELERAVLKSRKERFGDEHAKTLQAMMALGNFLENAGQFEESTSLIQEAFEKERHLLGADHPETLKVMLELGARLSRQGKLDQAEPILREVLQKRRRLLGDDHKQTLVAINHLGSVLEQMGNLAEAEALSRESLERHRRTLGDDHPDTLRALGNLGYIIALQGHSQDAEQYYRQALAGLRRVFGNDHPHTLTSIGNLAALLSGMGRDAEAEPLYLESLEGRRRTLGDDHPSTLNAIYNMGDMLRRAGKLTEAEPYCRQALEGYRRVGGDDHIGTLYSLTNLGYLLLDQGKPADAEPYFQEAVERRRRINGDDYFETFDAVIGLAASLESQKRWTDAEQWRRFVLAFVTRKEPIDSVRHAGALCALGRNVLRQERPIEAEEPLAECLSIYKETDRSEDWLRWNAQSLLGEAIATDHDRYTEAKELLLEAANQMLPLASDASKDRLHRIAQTKANLVAVYDAMRNPIEADKWRSQTLPGE